MYNLPKGWEMTTLGDISENVMYGMNAKAIAFDGKRKYIRITDIDEDTNKFRPNPLTSPDGSIDQNYKLMDGDIVFARTGASAGKSYMFEADDGDLYFAGFLIRFHIANHVPYFVFMQTQTSSYHNWVKSVSMRSGQPGINAEEFKKLPIIIAPKEEQVAISDTIRTWDTAIEKTEALIAAKEKQFNWLAKVMMNYEHRDNWTTSTIGQVSKIKKGQQINRSSLKTKDKYQVWNGGITPSGYTDQCNTSKNTITISEGGNSCGFVNFSEENFWLGGHCYALEKIENIIYPPFLFHYLKSRQKKIMKLRVGSGLPNIQRSDIAKFEIIYPPIHEQQQISSMFRAAQNEIRLLSQLAKLYRVQKHGLMQKFLRKR